MQGNTSGKKVLFSISVLLLLAVCAVQAHAVAIGVNKARLDFSDVLRGGYAEATVVVSTDSEEPIGGEVLLEGEASSWFNFSQREFNFSRSAPYELKVMIQPPLDTQLQDYNVNLSVITGSIGRSEGGKMGTSTRASFRIPVKIKMTGTERIACTAGGVRVLDTERGQPLELLLTVLNGGNVRINPEIIVEIFDQDRAKTVTEQKTDFGTRILPTASDEASRSLQMTLQPGQYWASVKVPMCDYASVMTFDVLEPGGIKDDGDFIRIDAQSWANTGDIIPIKAVFRNRGVRGVRATFKGTIVHQDTKRVVKVISTDEYVVDPEVTAELETFFNPEVGGQYIVSGKIYYNNKLSIERNTLINVNGAPRSGVAGISSSTIIIGVVLAIIIFFLVLIIRKKKQQQYR